MGADRTQTSSLTLYGPLNKRNRDTVVSGPTNLNVAPVFSPSSRIHRKASCACGGECPNCQAKSSNIRVSDPNDSAEIEADRVADTVMRMPAGKPAPPENRSIASGVIHREFEGSNEEEETVQRKPLAGSNGIPAQSPAHVHDAVGSGGRPLDQQTRGFFESRMGYDLGSVRIHADSTAGVSARALDARAYTLGSNIVFGSAQYSPGSQSGMHLLAHELAHVVQNGHTASASGGNVLQRDRRRRRGGAPPPPPTPDYFINDQKKIFKQEAAGGQLVEVGFEDSGGKRYVTADDTDIWTNSDGKLHFGGPVAFLPLRKFYVLKANDLPASPVAGHTAIDKKGVASTSYRIFIGTKNYEILTAKDKPDSIPTPIPVTKLHADISAKFVQKADIDLDSGHYWILLKFAKPPDTVEALHWSKAKETSREFSKRGGEIVDVVNTLPANLRTEALKHSDLLTAISIAEGNFKAAAGAGDTSASLGIFQWALEKNKSTDPNSSLVQYFQTLKKRAADASAKAAATRTDEEKLFIAAWAQLTAKGVDVTAGGTAQMARAPATGSMLQSSLASEFGTGSLQKYQIQAALDKIEDVRSLIIRPRHGLKDPFGSHYSDDRNKGATAFFKSDVTVMRTVRGRTTSTKKSFELAVDAPAAAARLKDVLKTEESLAIATTIYANRPSYISTAVWLALNGDVDLKARVKEITVKIAENERAAGKSLMPIDTSALEAASEPLLKELQELIWIDVSKIAMSEPEIVANMITFALSFYPRADLKKYERWERIATAFAPFNTPNW
jgi:hypothetical protein